MSEHDTIGWIAIVIALDGLAALAGGLVPDRTLARWRPAMLGFAAGTLLGSGALEIFPDALERIGGTRALRWALAAMAALAVFEWFTSRRSAHAARPVSPIALLGSDALHNIADGMAIAAAFLISPRVGLSTSVAVIVHELPEELADYALLRAAGMSRRTALWSLALVQLTAAAGAASTLLAATALAGIQGVVLAIAAGMFVYIGAIDLLPKLVRARSVAGWIAFAAGAVLSSAVAG